MDIKSIRLSCGMSQAKFAESVGIPLRTIENWETGARVPPDYLVRLLKYFVDHELQKK